MIQHHRLRRMEPLPHSTVMADTYDATFTESVIGRAQRNVVWRALQRTFRPGDRVLELNCGTGEDALFLAKRGVSVVACDASARMIEIAERRKSLEAPDASLEFHVLRNEDVDTLTPADPFDGVVSNFSGLNCVEDLSRVVRKLDSSGKAWSGRADLYLHAQYVCGK